MRRLETLAKELQLKCEVGELPIKIALLKHILYFDGDNVDSLISQIEEVNPGFQPKHTPFIIIDGFTYFNGGTIFLKLKKGLYTYSSLFGLQEFNTTLFDEWGLEGVDFEIKK